MPLTFQVDHRRDTVLINGAGTITLDEVLQLLDDMAADEPHISGKDGIIDVSQATDTQMTFDSVRRISDRVTRLNDLFRGTRWAIIAPGDVMYGVARIYETLRSSGPFEVRAFRTADEAGAWISQRGPSL